MKNERFMFPERIETIKELEQIGNLALRKAHEVHEELGALGEEALEKNQFGDTTLRGDVEAENAVLEVLKENNVPIKIISEEHGTTVIEDEPLYLGILDGIDGSLVYKSQRGKGRYATMFGIFKSTDPLYKDYIYGGMLEHSTNILYYASKGNGSWTVDGNVKKQIHCLQTKVLDPKTTNLYADTAYDEIFNKNVIANLILGISEFDIKCLRASSIQYADLANGRVHGNIECTRKNNLEIAIAYPIVIEAGGIIVDVNGESLGNKKYSEFGQKEHLGVISACTQDLATALVERINRV